MVAALRRLWCETVDLTGIRWVFGRRQQETKPYMVGEFEADYGPIPSDEIQKSDPEVEALFARSKIVSAKPGL